MKVSFINNKNLSFCAKKSDIRTADHIMRTSRKAFPVVSSSYIDEFFHSKKGKETGLIEKISDRVFEDIANIRELNRRYVAPKLKLKDVDRNIMYAPILRGMEQLRAGNCSEASVGALAALAANQIYDGRIVNLLVDTIYTNKKTGETEFKSREFIDHCFVVTSMGQKTTDEKDQIIVDPWLSFCDSSSAAIAKYKQIFQDKYMNKALEQSKKQFVRAKEKDGVEINWDNYEISQRLTYTNPNIPKEIYMKEFGQYCKDNFPELIIKDL